MKILITGANGLLGVRLARALADAQHEVLAMVRRPGENADLQYPGITEIKGDVADRASLSKAMHGVQQLYHLAALSTDWAPDMRSFYRVNIQGTINVLDAALAAGVIRVVNTSSAGVIGPPEQDDIHPVDETHVRTAPFFLDYEASKAIAEERVLRYVLKGMDIVTVSPTRVFGPGPLERKNGYLLLFNNYLKGKLVAYPGLKTQLANFVHVDDVVRGMQLAMEKGMTGENYLLGGSNVTFPDLFEALERVTGKKVRTLPIPIWVMGLAARIDAVLARLGRRAPAVTRTWLRKASYSWPVSSEKAMRELGYQPMEYETAVRETVKWLQAERDAGRIR